MDRQSIDEADSATVVAVIFGASEFPRAETLSPSPAFERSATAFAEYLTGEQGFRLADDQVLDLFDDDANVIDQNDRLIDHLQGHQNASDLIIYYVGHGGFLPDREYFLALRSTRQGAEGVTGLRIKALAHALDEHFPGKRVFLILDCCFAGEAVAQFQSDGLEDIITNDTFDALPAAGTSLLCAASKNEPAISPTGATYTMFSDCLLEVLRQGFEDSRQSLSLADIGEVVQKLIKRKFGQGSVRPEVHSPHQDEGDIAKVPLFPNPAYTPPKPKSLPPEILEALRNPLADIRQGAVRPLAQYLSSGDEALARLARAELQGLATGDDSLSVRQAAREAMGEPVRPEPEPVPKPTQRAERKPKPTAEPKPKPETKPKPVPSKPRLPTPVLMTMVAVIVLVLGAGVWWSTLDHDAPPPPPPADDVVSRLLSEADQHFQAGRLDSPEGNNAVASYRDVLAREPDNPRARAGLDRVVARFVALMDEALDTNNLDKAKGFLAGAEGIAPADERVTGARARIEKVAGEASEARKIEQALAAAGEDVRAGRLGNAVKQYRAVLALKPDSRAARDGLRGIVEQYVALADDAVSARELDKAEEYVAKAEGISPGDERVAMLRARIQTATTASNGSERVQNLLAEAEQDIQQNRLTTPAGNNAVERYRAVLAIDPSNEHALAGLGRVVDKYVRLANRALAKEDLGRAAGFLAKAEGIGVEKSGLVTARARLDEVRAGQEKIARLLTAGDAALQHDRLDSPAGKNALEHYRAVLKLDPGNQDAEAGMGRVADRYLTLGRQAIDRRDLPLAEDYLAKTENLQPDSPKLAGYRAALQAAATPSALTFAIFPFESIAVCHYSVRDEVIDAADAVVRKQPRAEFSYSYYEEGADASAIPATSKLWSDNRAHREPKLDAVREAGRRLGVNGVLMVWYKCSHIQHVPADRYEVEVHLIDVDGDQAFRAKDGFLDADRAISDVFGQFFAAHGIGSG